MYISLRVYLLSKISGDVNYRLVFLCFILKRHLWESTNCICLSRTGLPHSLWCFLDPSICLQISRCHFFFYLCVVLHCVYVPLFLYQFFGWGAFRLFPALAFTNNAAMNIVKRMPLWDNWASFVYKKKVVLLGLEVDCFLIFWETDILISKVAV